MELTGAALRSWQALAQRHDVATGPLVRAVGVYLLDHERLEPRDFEFVLALARGLDDLRPELDDLRTGLVDLPAAEVDSAMTALEAAIASVDRAKRILEDAGLRETGRALGSAQTALHDARRIAQRTSNPPGA